MNKKRCLKKWVVNLLVAINILLFVLLASDCENLMIFFASKMIFGSLFAINTMILYKKSHLFED